MSALFAEPLLAPRAGRSNARPPRTEYRRTELANREMRLAGFEVFVPMLFRPGVPPRHNAAGAMQPDKPDRLRSLQC